MLEQLKELLEMQRVLDANIYETHGVEYNEEKTYMALFDELGELNHELKPIWCLWKKTVMPLDREKVLEELSDVWHFALSIAYHNIFNDVISLETVKMSVSNLEMREVYRRIISIPCQHMILTYMLVLTEKLDFTFDDVYEAYKKKNAVNYQRLRNGY